MLRTAMIRLDNGILHSDAGVVDNDGGDADQEESDQRDGHLHEERLHLILVVRVEVSHVPLPVVVRN